MTESSSHSNLEDRRQDPRFSVDAYFSLRTIFPNFEGGRSREIMDMSVSGLKFKSENAEKIETGEIISARIYLSDKIYQTFDLKVVRKDHDGIACEFIRDNSENREILFHFLEFLRLASKKTLCDSTNELIA